MILIDKHLCTNKFRAAVFKHGRDYYEIWDSGIDGQELSLARGPRALRVTCGSCLDPTVPLICIDNDSSITTSYGVIDCTWEAFLADPLERLMEALL